MKKLKISETINSPKEKVWENTFGENTYPEWTEVFAPGSHVKGSWEKGSRIKFLAPDNEGKMQGMLSEIVENKPFEFLSIKHLGFIKDGAEDTESPEVKAWAPSFENYTFTETDGVTLLTVEMDTTDEYYDYFMETWPKALQKIKHICEKS
ncbi:MAG: SRPBCC domain-containing protein [Ignavibacteria bacterium]|nr:SRPBCC domain-containing protein [Ignavibacteria bacterium]